MPLSALKGLLKIQRELLEIPRSSARFESYLKTLTGGGNDLRVPLSGFNPMSKDHVRDVLDHLLEQGAEDLLAECLERAQKELAPAFSTHTIQVGLVVSDDLKGGWTCRETLEMQRRQDQSNESKRGWLTVLVWSSEGPVSRENLRRSLEQQLALAAALLTNPAPKTLGELVVFEGQAQAYAKAPLPPGPGPAWLERFRALLKASDLGTWIAAWYGDQSAQRLGYPLLGFEAGAGPEFAAWERVLK